MNNRFLKNGVLKSTGITLIEILVVIAVLAILLSFALPSLSGPMIRSEMKATMENVEYSLRVARNTARMNETGVSLEIRSSADGEQQSIAYTTPSANQAGIFAGIQDYQIPTDFELVSDRDSFVFDERGLVEEPGQIVLVSRLDESISSVIAVE